MIIYFGGIATSGCGFWSKELPHFFSIGSTENVLFITASDPINLSEVFVRVPHTSTFERGSGYTINGSDAVDANQVSRWFRFWKVRSSPVTETNLKCGTAQKQRYSVAVKPDGVLLFIHSKKFKDYRNLEELQKQKIVNHCRDFVYFPKAARTDKVERMAVCEFKFWMLFRIIRLSNDLLCQSIYFH